MASTFRLFGDDFSFHNAVLIGPVTLQATHADNERHHLREQRLNLILQYGDGLDEAGPRGALGPHLANLALTSSGFITFAVHRQILPGGSEALTRSVLRGLSHDIREGSVLSIFKPGMRPEIVGTAADLFAHLADTIEVVNGRIVTAVPIYLPTANFEEYWAERRASASRRGLYHELMECWEVGLETLRGTHSIMQGVSEARENLLTAGCRLVRLDNSHVRLLGAVLDRLGYVVEFFLRGESLDQSHIQITEIVV